MSVVEKFDIHPYKVIISRDPRFLEDLLKSTIVSKYFYRYTIYLAGSKIFSRGYIKNKDECKKEAIEYLEGIMK